MFNVAKSAKFAEFQKCQLNNLVDFDKCCKTRIYLQRSVLIQAKTSDGIPCGDGMCGIPCFSAGEEAVRRGLFWDRPLRNNFRTRLIFY